MVVGSPQVEGEEALLSTDPRAALRTVRILILALIMGIVLFGGVALGIGPVGGEDAVPDVLLWVAAAMTVTLALPSGALAKLLGGSASPTPQQYVQVKILGAALAEGPGLMWCVITLLGGNPIHILGAAVSVIALMTQLPAAGDLETED